MQGNTSQSKDGQAGSSKTRIKIPSFQEIERRQEEQDLSNITHTQLQNYQHDSNAREQQSTDQPNTVDISKALNQDQQRQQQQMCVQQRAGLQHHQQHVNARSVQITKQGGQQQYPASSLVVNHNQQGNPLLPFIRHVGHVFGDIIPDYLIGENTAVLFLSLRFHKLKPNHIHIRIKQLARAYRAYLLCHVDVDDPHVPLMDITKLAIDNQLTLICAFSNRECARYLETLKVYENKPADSLKERLQEDHQSRVAAAFTMIRGVNKTDCATMGTKFGTVADILKSKSSQLSSCPGIGPAKAKRLHEAFNTPLIKNKTIVAKPPEQQVQNINNDFIEDVSDSDVDDFQEEL
eukprot:TRINITY_DN34049_c0_g1_i1.p1 TRINITY_DN34049_c0_g1~~TRINITY_DN34049_c0_g1_i1.p1  ORF type:complete len:349 (-),score=30.63 TRINITY_DN34049_c0_g1_i1:359-1405(-)